MKTLPPPHVPGTTEADRMDNAVRQLFSVSKEAMLKEEARQKVANQKRRSKAKKPD